MGRTGSALDSQDNPLETRDDLVPSQGRESETHDIQSAAERALKRFQAEIMAREPQLVDDNVALRVEIQGATTPLILTLSEVMVIGRRDPTSDYTPDLDLTSYGGYQMGISRRHAVIEFRDRQLSLQDLGSRNGTYLNGQRLHPNQPVSLRDRDELRLGKIVLRLHLQPL